MDGPFRPERGCHSFSPRQPLGSVGHLFGGTWDQGAPAAGGSLTCTLTDPLCAVCLLPQHGARYFPTCRLLFRDSGPSGHAKQKTGSRNCLTHIRICIQVCKFLEIDSKDGICHFLSPGQPLTGTCWPVPLSLSPPGQPLLAPPPPAPLPLGRASSQNPPEFSSFHLTAFLP